MCPKCNGDAFLSEEEFVQVVESVTPAKIIIKEIYICKGCGEKFSRIAVHDLITKTSAAGTSDKNIVPGLLEDLTIKGNRVGSEGIKQERGSDENTTPKFF
ncbi:MAG: hypothetical protein DRP03_03690 [Candidatus Aenigmatarchaeota archaeon]|nr:MAG: hypothetical protein DRP03_03690 [Candidatus Aenigmarchaeota archaeon]